MSTTENIARQQDTKIQEIKTIFNSERYKALFNPLMAIAHPNNSEIATLDTDAKRIVGEGLGFIWDSLEALSSAYEIAELDITALTPADALLDFNLLATTPEAAARIIGGSAPDIHRLDMKFIRAVDNKPAKLLLTESYTRRKVTSVTLVDGTPISLSDDRRTRKVFEVRKNTGEPVIDGLETAGDYLIKLLSKTAVEQHYHIITEAPEFSAVVDKKLETPPSELTPDNISVLDVSRLVFIFWHGLTGTNEPKVPEIDKATSL